MWIDLNQDGNFGTDEYFPISTSSTSGIANYGSFSIPWGTATGNTRMRIRTRLAGSPNGAADACTIFNSGETEDYTVTIDLLNSNNSFAANQQIKLFPNPAKEQVKLIAQPANGNYRIKNMLGEIIASDKIVNTETVIDLRNLAKGVYMIEVLSAERTSILKLVKE